MLQTIFKHMMAKKVLQNTTLVPNLQDILLLLLLRMDLPDIKPGHIS